MIYAGEHIFAALKEARQRKGLSQRDLSSRAGVPQSHISKIETGSVDLQLSSLIDLARALDLEVMTVPRKLVPAVESILRTGESEVFRQVEETRQALKHLKRIRKNAARLERVPDSAKELLDVQRTAAELEGFRIGPTHLQAIRDISETLRDITPGPGAKERLHRAANKLKILRNNLAHNVAEPPTTVRPAYTLDEEDGDA
jgi:transcriptional regulator with XRE-family HTH domain